MRVVSGVTMLAAAFGLLGCSALPGAPGSGAEGPPPDYVNVVRTQEMLIQLVPHEAEAAQPNDHPAAFEPEQLRALLLSMRVASEGEGVVTLASPERLTRVSEGLAEAFARARPSQDIFLAFFRRKSGELMFTSQRRATSARVFFRDDRLHLIFDELDAAYGPFRDPQTNPLRPGRRDRAQDVDGGRLVATETWHWHDERRDWVELTATAEAIRAAEAAVPSLSSTGAGESARTLSYGPAAGKNGGDAGQAEVVPAPAPKPDKARSPRADEDSKASTAQPAGEGDRSDAWARIEQRLEKLKRLRERGLITEQEYADKKAELLEELP